jgi:hypothetical protein
MYKSSTYLVFTYFPTYLPIYETYFLQNFGEGGALNWENPGWDSQIQHISFFFFHSWAAHL